MNKVSSFIHIIVICFAILGCNHPNEVLNQTEIFVDFNKEIKEIDLCQYLDTSICEMIVLETTDECVIGEVSRIAWHNDTLVICDSESKGVFFFNKDGKFLSKICRFGRNGQEYMDAYDFFIGKDEIIILDNMNSKIYSYDFVGNFKYSFEIDSGVSVCEYDGNIFVYGAWKFDGDNHPIVSVYNKKGDNEMNYFNVTEKGSHYYSCNDHFFPLTSEFSMFNEDNYTLYKYYDNNFTESYSFNFGDKMMPYKYLKHGIEYIFEHGYHKDYVSGISQMWESDRYIFCNVVSGDHTMVYDKKRGAVSVGEMASYDRFGILRGKTFVDGEYIYSYQTGAAISGIRFYVWNKEDKPLKKEEKKLKELTQTLTETDNGVIIRMKLKGNDED